MTMTTETITEDRLCPCGGNTGAFSDRCPECRPLEVPCIRCGEVVQNSLFDDAGDTTHESCPDPQPPASGKDTALAYTIDKDPPPGDGWIYFDFIDGPAELEKLKRNAEKHHAIYGEDITPELEASCQVSYHAWWRPEPGAYHIGKYIVAADRPLTEGMEHTDTTWHPEKGK